MIGFGVPTKKVHDLVGTELLELRAQTASDPSCSFSKFGAPVFPDARGDPRDDDLAAFDTEGHPAAWHDTGNRANVLGDRHLTLVCHEHARASPPK